MGRTIACARERDDLYFLEELNLFVIKKHQPQLFMSESVLSKRENILLFHCWLEHPSFGVIKVMFPSLFSGSSVRSFHCDVCKIAKHVHVYFLLSNERSTFPFHLVHTDVWGPSPIPDVFETRWFVIFIDDCTRVTRVFLS